jgi:hypothetical protein
MTIDQISVFVENKKGRLADVTDVLAASGLDLKAMSIADTSDYGVLRFIVCDPARAVTVLNAAGYIVSLTSVIAASIPDRPGGLALLLRMLSDGGINVEYLYAFLARKQENAYVILRADDCVKAEKFLLERGILLASPEDLMKI